jgi:hypothetical protein
MEAAAMTNLLGGWQIKLIAAALILAAIAGLLWHDKHQTDRANRLARENATLAESIEAERKARAHELKIAKEASDGYAQRLSELQAARADTPTRSVRLCRSASPAVPATAGAALGTDAAGDAGHAGEAGQGVEAGPDIGAALYSLADEKDEELARCASLQKWVLSR